MNHKNAFKLLVKGVCSPRNTIKKSLYFTKRLTLAFQLFCCLEEKNNKNTNLMLQIKSIFFYTFQSPFFLYNRLGCTKTFGG